MAKSHEEKQFIQLAGEFGVVSELCRRQIQASITYGNSKRTDVYVISQQGSRAAKIEVKSSVKRSWIVNEKALEAAPHIVWVFVFMPVPNDTASRAQVAEIGASTPSYHVLSSAEVKRIYEAKINGGDPPPIKFTFAELQFKKDQWDRVREALVIPQTHV